MTPLASGIGPGVRLSLLSAESRGRCRSLSDVANDLPGDSGAQQRRLQFDEPRPSRFRLMLLTVAASRPRLGPSDSEKPLSFTVLATCMHSRVSAGGNGQLRKEGT